MKTPLFVAALSLAALTFAAPALAQQHWVATWEASPAPGGKDVYADQTLREIVHVTLGGPSVRIQFSNAFGATPLVLGGAHIAIRASGAAIQPGTDRALTFGGQPTFTIPVGASALSDPVALDVPANSDLAISLYLPQSTIAATGHPLALQTSYAVAGNHLADATLAAPATFVHWPFLSGVAVDVPATDAAIVTLGDSITDGYESTPDANHRWPNYLADRLTAAGATTLAVDNAGISANRILHGTGEAGTPALERLDRDVLTQPGARYLIVLEGINDIGQPGAGEPESEAVTVSQITGGLQQIIARAHELGMKVYGATLTPFTPTGGGYYTPAKEQKRVAVNQWIRQSNAFDGVIDFDKATRDPQHPDRFLPAYDSGDHLHPSDAGYKAMADAINLALFH